MREYEYRRTVFYQTRDGFSFPDEHKNFNITVDQETIVQNAVNYLVHGTDYLLFPGAARAVAIAAADFISREFNEDFFDVLNDPNLMHGNDPYFVPYEKDKETYDEIIKAVNGKINWDSHRMGITLSLLQQEYMLDENGLAILPREGWKYQKGL